MDRLARQLLEVENKASILSRFITTANTPFAEAFPKTRLIVLAQALSDISKVSSVLTENILKVALGRCRAIRRDSIPFDDEEEGNTETNLHTRGFGVDTPLGELINEIATALDFFERSKPLADTGKPDFEHRKTASDEADFRDTIRASEELSTQFDLSIDEAQALFALHKNQSTEDLIAALYGVEVFNKLGRVELLGDPVPNWLDRIRQGMGGAQGALTVAGDSLILSADLADAAVNFLRDNITPYTNLARNVAAAFGNQVKRMQARSAPPPPFDIDEIKENLIKGIAPHPAHVPRLEVLNFIDERRLVDLSALSGLPGLQELDLRGTGVSDVSALSGLTGLRTLYLDGTGVSDVSALSGLTGLQVLNLSETGVSDVSALSGLTGLQRLYLSGTGVSDVSALSGLTGLQVLNLSETCVSDVSALSGLMGLQELYLRETGVRDENLKALQPLIDTGLSVYR